ncbi:hypothetical protein [Pseudaminobacter soli (ex Li et al. 2025)]|uniref:Uncharacterized protein n=1 Tax=Pseudaminobacter soli (ex Li et al. 2025) TaxID=1295366 RepID=A0A2P7S003_9HYPH|nr:hypothetical protein [Mesorhizobium soli]PSJ55774.1 hypothetical protein C7I85_26150 [Mesorhizobium soli]
MADINYSHRHRWNGQYISSTTGTISVGDIRDAIAAYPDDANVHLSVCDHGGIQHIFGFKSRGPNDIQFLVSGSGDD